MCIVIDVFTCIGCRGSCSEEIIKKYDLRKGKDVQTYGLGIKEVWKIPDKVSIFNLFSRCFSHTTFC